MGPLEALIPASIADVWVCYAYVVVEDCCLATADIPGSKERIRSKRRKGKRWGRYAPGSGLNRRTSKEVDGEIGTFRRNTQVQRPFPIRQSEE